MHKGPKSLLTAMAFGFVAVVAAPSATLADAVRDYRIIGCDEPDEMSFPPPEPAFTVIFSSSPEEVGQSCEAVLTSLGAQGFRLIKVREQSLFLDGILHYLVRRVNDSALETDD